MSDDPLIAELMCVRSLVEDEIGLADIINVAIAEIERLRMENAILQVELAGWRDTAAIKLGRLGGTKGGMVRASRMTPEARTASARLAAKARWNKL